MAIILTKPLKPLAATSAARLTSAVCAALLVAGCSSMPQTTIQSVEPEAVVEDRFSGSADEEGYTAIVPRTNFANEVRSNAPQIHTVVRGDTLWAIAGKFLKSPWLWPQIWGYNPDIKNPNLIYPDDKIALEYVNGQPRFVVSRDGRRLTESDTLAANELNGQTSPKLGRMSSSGNAERLSPRIREENLEQAIDTIPGDAIQQFLVYPRVVTMQDLENAPYVVGNYEGRLTSALNHQIYARGTFSPDQLSYGVFRRNKSLVDPITGEMLGYEVTHVANAKLLQLGDPSTLVIEENRLETMNGDLLMTSSMADVTHNYVPRLPKMQGEGRIISLINSITQSGRNQIVVLNLGKRSGVKIGDIMAIERRGGTFVDDLSDSGFERISMPSTRTGVLMVFQTFDKVSYALVMESTRPIHLQDIITDI